MSFLGDSVMFVIRAVSQLLFLYEIVVIAAVVLSWVNPDPWNPIVRTIRSLTDPVFDAFRRIIPLIGSLDLSPMAVLFAIEFVRSVALPHLGRSLAGM